MFRVPKRKATESLENDEGEFVRPTSIQQPGTAGSNNFFCAPPYSKYQAPALPAKCDFGHSTAMDMGSNVNCSKLGNGIQSKASGPDHPFKSSAPIQNGNSSQDVPTVASRNPARLNFLKRMASLNKIFANSVQQAVESHPSLSLAPMVRDYLYFTRVIMEEQIGRPDSPQISKSFKSLGDFFEEFELKYVLRSTNINGTTSQDTVPPNPNVNIQDSAPTNPNLNGFSTSAAQECVPSTSNSIQNSAPTSIFNGFSTSAQECVPSTSNSIQNSAPQKPNLSIFTFSSQITPTTTSEEKVEEDEDDGEDEPPKVEVVQVKEDDSVYSVRCKIYNLVDGSYKDKGVGTLYIKENEKGTYQVVVRADNNLGTILLNILLQKSLPLAKNKNSVSTVDLSKKDVNGKPLPVCIKVKEEFATELFDKLKEFQQA